ncbi:hypothetical protein L249_1405 [Ophiocordyceps polyrhachis-furcata BCC 54312]|uniref:Uncharacterized protein n=1 Tax=Ophiocordyceps polyrhachis-furcata BCC 54312 TaxID=1330021 RepID=A0A367L477_9HYPO|nr:hypothetical protein L249_1405 [Ophiocordyceps polyrhachis-furcata BCC 54312]
MADADLPIALRKPRRSVNGVSSRPAPALCDPQTPRRTKRAVRFSDPGPRSLRTTGLTPMIKRTSIATPQRRRASTPSRTTTPSKTARADAVPAREVAPQCLRHTTDGRVERRIRRNNFRELLNRLEQQKKSRTRELARLKAEIKARDRDIYELRNATVIVDTERIWHLERQVTELKEELEVRSTTGHGIYDWVRDSLGDDDDDDDGDEATNPFSDDDQDDHFGDMAVLNLAASTPSRALRSRDPLTPPATSPTGPGTPCWRDGPDRVDAAVQASFTDPRVEEELASLRLEVKRLTTTLDSHRDLGERIGRRLQASAASVAGFGAIEQQIESLVRTLSDRTAALSKLTSDIAALGFPGHDAGDMVAALATGFRSARLELEYLTPGELTLPLTSRGPEILDELLSRLRQLAKGAAEDEATIDEYHATEQSLRKQLDSRVSAMDDLSADASRAQRLAEEQRVANHRLRHAIDGYVRDMSELEALIERMEREGGAALAARDASIAALENRLSDTLSRAHHLETEVSAAGDVGVAAALAMRDARILDLTAELDLGRQAVAGLEAGLDAERGRVRDAMRRVVDIGKGFLDEA